MVAHKDIMWVMGSHHGYHLFTFRFGLDRKMFRHLPSTLMGCRGIDYRAKIITLESFGKYELGLIQWFMSRGAQFRSEEEFEEAFIHVTTNIPTGRS